MSDSIKAVRTLLRAIDLLQAGPQTVRSIASAMQVRDEYAGRWLRALREEGRVEFAGFGETPSGVAPAKYVWKQ